jgi:hypothetical protein
MAAVTAALALAVPAASANAATTAPAVRTTSIGVTGGHRTIGRQFYPGYLYCRFLGLQGYAAYESGNTALATLIYFVYINACPNAAI